MQKRLCLIGAIICIVGSFLPWEERSGFVSYWRKGIRVEWGWANGGIIYPIFIDEGGLLIALLCISVIVVIIYKPGFIVRPNLWVSLFAVGVVLSSTYHFVELLSRIEVLIYGVNPSLKIGLVIVLFGAWLMFFVMAWERLKFYGNRFLSKI
jgi:hypothetical protein